jgi:hypothetical protein
MIGLFERVSSRSGNEVLRADGSIRKCAQHLTVSRNERYPQLLSKRYVFTVIRRTGGDLDKLEYALTRYCELVPRE